MNQQVAAAGGRSGRGWLKAISVVPLGMGAVYWVVILQQSGPSSLGRPLLVSSTLTVAGLAALGATALTASGPPVGAAALAASLRSIWRVLRLASIDLPFLLGAAMAWHGGVREARRGGLGRGRWYVATLAWGAAGLAVAVLGMLHT
jgi:hypothetical protein